MDCGFEEDDELLLSDGEILKSVCKQNELTEKFFEEVAVLMLQKKATGFWKGVRCTTTGLPSIL